ncbi:peptide MFS transporter [Paraliomyxa miuraensis]|uniref:peptide MFS transporter n=1 Tax=Paraliomyxa miuraensis TaxID=376150 RepID=UPI00224F067E|nr:peptide MFS transporter [Paraliomyxa miuraensis]MCX4243888.1 peptide MFS transporter [Paraliomyxa miuraensis]
MANDDPTQKGHPKGLYALFFTEMWERLAFYTMVGILLLYTTDTERGGLGMPSAEGNEIYGLYLAFVYFTPFLGGMIADRYLGYRRAVLVGAICMASGLFLMSVPGKSFFLLGLLGLIIGNGFFKPNISVMVGNLYEPGDARRDAGFNIFYMGINIGALVANLMAAAVRNEAGWLWTFRIAGLGLIVSMLILLSQWKNLSGADRQPAKDPDGAGLSVVFAKILLPTAAFGALGYFLAQWLATHGMLPAGMRPAIVGFLFGMLPVVYFFVNLVRGASDDERPGLRALLPIYIAGGTFFMILHLNGSAMTQWARDNTARDQRPMVASLQQDALPSYYLTAQEDTPRPDPRSLGVVAEDRHARMFGQQRLDQEAVAAIAAENPDLRVVELPVADDGGQPPEVIARAAAVYADGVVTVKEGEDSHGAKTIDVSVPEGAKPTGRVAFVRDVEGKTVGVFVVDRALHQALYQDYESRFGHAPQLLPPGEYLAVTNPEIFQSLNAFFVIAFTPLLVGFFASMQRRGKGLSTAQKLLLGMVLTTASLLLMSLAGVMSDGGAVRVSWLWLGGFYAVVTIGELCLSPMGLSLVTKLTPPRLVGLTMGGWFLATAFGNNFSGFFGGIQGMMTPVSFFLLLAGLAGLVALYLRLVLPGLDATIKKYGG